MGDTPAKTIRVSRNAPVEVLVLHGARRTLRWAACRVHDAKERRDKIAMADARTGTADARAAINVARGVDHADIDGLGLSINRDAYEHSRESWLRALREHPSDREIQLAHAVRADWLARRPQWDDDWGIPLDDLARYDRVTHSGDGCACGITDAGQLHIDPACREAAVTDPGATL